jgi:hypothetical protein
MNQHGRKSELHNFKAEIFGVEFIRMFGLGIDISHRRKGMITKQAVPFCTLLRTPNMYNKCEICS